ncbi:hypothetical protein AXY1_40 [Achromobacter phage AXY1]|nr:hypothetical protein AXY1_40 [Achromobacter phage AXY1]
MTDTNEQQSRAALLAMKHKAERLIERTIRDLLDASFDHAETFGKELIGFQIDSHIFHYEKKHGTRHIRADDVKVHITYGEQV